MRTLSTFSLLLVFLVPTAGYSWDQNDEEALRRTQAILQNPNALKGNGNPDEKAALEAVQKLTRDKPALEGQVHGLSADIFAQMAKKSDGDPAKILEMLQKAQSDPKKFYESLSPAQQAEIRRIASELEQKK